MAEDNLLLVGISQAIYTLSFPASPSIFQLNIHGSCAIIGARVFGIVDQYDATDLHFPFVLEIDVVWEVAVRVAHPFCVPEGGRFAVEHKGSSAVFALPRGFLRAKSCDAPFFLWNFGEGVRHEGLHALHILGVNGRCHILRMELCECFVGGKKVAGLKIFQGDFTSALGFNVTA